MRLLIVIAACAFVSSASAVDYMMLVLDEPAETAPPAETPPAKPHLATIWDTKLGHIWQYSNGGEIYETYADYVRRTGKPILTCESNHCSSPSAGPVKPSTGCTCGCSPGGLCNCHHSPNVGVRKDVVLTKLPVKAPPASSAAPETEPESLETSDSARPAATQYQWQQVCTAYGCQWLRVPINQSAAVQTEQLGILQQHTGTGRTSGGGLFQKILGR